MAQEKVRVVIEVRGGNVQAVYAGDFVEVVVVDWDNINASHGYHEDPPEGAVLMEVDRQEFMPAETAALVAAALEEEATLRKLAAYGNEIGAIVGHAVTPGEARPFYNTGYTPEAAAHELGTRAHNTP